MGEKLREPSPCMNCDRKGCGVYHDICPDYQGWLNSGTEIEKEILRAFIPEKTWNSRRGRSISKKKQNYKLSLINE